MEIRDFILHPFSVRVANQPRLSLSSKDKKTIAYATIIAAILTCGLAAPIMFFALSYKYRIKLLKTRTPQEQVIVKTANQALKITPSTEQVK